MALMPKRVRHRKSQRGRIKGKAQRGNRVVFGDFGLQAMQGGWIKAQTIESGRIAAQQYVRGEGRLYIRMPADAGTGVIAGSAVRAVCEAAGIKNVITKSFNTGNAITVVKATIDALKKMRTQQDVERLRGVPLT